MGDSASGRVRCPFALHSLRFSEIGRGPFTGSSFDVVVSDGKVAHVAQQWRPFSPQVWDPFQNWVSRARPKDAAVMYTDGCCNVRLTQKSIRLWERNTQRYVDKVNRSD